MIEIKRVNKFYNRSKRNEVHAVNDVSLSIPENGMIALFGKSGCGKTTLLNLVGGLDYVASGEVIIDGERISPDSDKIRNAAIGYIFQNYNLSKKMTVFDNVAAALRLIGITDEVIIQERVDMALRAVDMQNFKKRYPDALSGGQQQRVAIARAIVKNPKVILADEPTGNLDEHNTVMVMNLLKSISLSCPVLLVTHEGDLVENYCDRIIEIKDGAVISDVQNSASTCYVKSSVSQVYLADMKKSEITDGEHTVELFGENIPPRVRLISKGGTLYISVGDGVNVKIADKTSEITIHEGSEIHDTPKPVNKDLELFTNPLSSDSGKYGRLYRFCDCVKHAFKSNFIKPRAGKLALITALIILPLIISFLVAMAGTVLISREEILKNYDQNTVFVSSEVGKEYIAELQERFDIKNISGVRKISSSLPCETRSFAFDIAVFESYYNAYSYSNIHINGIRLPYSVIKNSTVLAGRITDLSDNEIVISKNIADGLLDETPISFIDSYNKLLNASYIDSQSMNSYKVVGIVDTSDSVVYMTEKEYTKLTFSEQYTRDIVLSEDVMMTDTPGRNEIYLSKYMVNTDEFTVGKKVIILGKEFTVTKIIDEADAELPGFAAGVICYEDMKELLTSEAMTTTKDLVAYTYGSKTVYYSLYTEDTSAIAEAVKREIGDSTDIIVTPDDIYSAFQESEYGDLGSTVITLAILGGILLFCLYMIMHSLMMGEIKEIGISRAIGASKKNILFKYFTETTTIFCCTVLIEYIFGVFIIDSLTSFTPALKSTLYLPPFLAIGTLILLYGASVVCGTLPTLLLLGNPPSEILSKYDI